MKLTAIKETVMNHGVARFAQMINIGLVSFILLSSGLQVSPAYARLATDDPPQEALDCLGDLQGTISATPQPVDLWQTATLRWNVTVPSSCTGTGVKLYVDNQVVSPTGSRNIQPIADTSSKLHAALPAVFGGAKRTLATTAIKVKLPSIVTITGNYMAPLLVQALRTPGTYISVANNVELNLSGRESIPIAAGVTLNGGRTAREAGPRLYTTIRPKVLFDIEGDNVRISGVRIEGPDHLGVVPKDVEHGVGILIYGDINIQIDHNEIYGWSEAAVRVNEFEGHPEYSHIDRMLPSENPTAVRIHDNYIHHNQQENEEGYGVALYNGAYALIERNVFDWNRHAIAGDGAPGTGYAAYRNLVLENGGYHNTYCTLGFVYLPLSVVPCPFGIPVYHHYTHQFDMHGQETCGIGDILSDSLHNCGDAGHSMYIRHNTFLYTAGDAIKLRGTPLHPDGMSVTSNVFAHDSLRASVDLVEALEATAIEQTETGLFESDNLLGVNGMNELGACDFDGDGINDSFLATGQTWWYSSGGDKPWVYLNTSLKRRSQVTLGFFNADNICDVWVDGIVYPGGKPQQLPGNHLPPGGGVLK